MTINRLKIKLERKTGLKYEIKNKPLFGERLFLLDLPEGYEVECGIYDKPRLSYSLSGKVEWDDNCSGFDESYFSVKQLAEAIRQAQNRLEVRKAWRIELKTELNYKTGDFYEVSEEPMNTELKLKVTERADDFDDIRSQEIQNEENKISFHVCNLWDCPEDALINRSLFNASDYISALNKGIELASKGYTKVVGEFTKDER